MLKPVDSSVTSNEIAYPSPRDNRPKRLWTTPKVITSEIEDDTEKPFSPAEIEGRIFGNNEGAS
jgi:hypothetical protein